MVPFYRDVHIYCYVMWTYSGSMLPEANTRRQEKKYPMMKVSQGTILKLLVHSVNSVPFLCRTGNMQSAILLSFVASSSLPPCELQCTHLWMPCYISPYIVYNICEKSPAYFRHFLKFPQKYTITIYSTISPLHILQKLTKMRINEFVWKLNNKIFELEMAKVSIPWQNR